MAYTTLSQNYLDRSKELCDLYSKGQLGTPEHTTLEQIPGWKFLSDAERLRLKGLAQDLNTTTNDQRKVLEINPQVQDKLNEALHEWRRKGEWDNVFNRIRRWEAYIEPAALSYLKSALWKEAGDEVAAKIFFDHAIKLQPSLQGKDYFNL